MSSCLTHFTLEPKHVRLCLQTQPECMVHYMLVRWMYCSVVEGSSQVYEHCSFLFMVSGNVNVCPNVPDNYVLS